MSELTLLVTYTAKPSMRETVLRALAARGIPELIRAEEGCLQYDYHLSIENADQILVLRDGDVVEQGTHRELMDRKGFYHQLYAAQFE